MAQKRLFVDLYKCDECEKCEVQCSYLYHARPQEHGIIALREMATFMLICRRCEDPSCVAACKFEALERQPDGVLKRYNMRCVSCKSCVQACPFGTIYPDMVPYYVNLCDLCGKRSGGQEPICVTSCVKNAIEYKEIEENKAEDIYVLNNFLAVRAPRWIKQGV